MNDEHVLSPRLCITYAARSETLQESGDIVQLTSLLLRALLVLLALVVRQD